MRRPFNNHNTSQRFTILLAFVMICVVTSGCVAQQSTSSLPEQTAKETANQETANQESKEVATVTSKNAATSKNETDKKVKRKVETASFGAGCFWCVEAVFQELNGVQSVKSGYMGGQTLNPTYEDICTGTTGHAEICQIKFDPSVITFKELLEVFWKTHDPTTLNRQGGDTGTQYRSAVFYNNDKQKELATLYKKKLNESGAFRNPIVTEVTKAAKFYPAEKKHDNYYKDNPNAGYCRAVILPKMTKFRAAFGKKLKPKK